MVRVSKNWADNIDDVEDNSDSSFVKSWQEGKQEVPVEEVSAEVPVEEVSADVPVEEVSSEVQVEDVSANADLPAEAPDIAVQPKTVQPKKKGRNPNPATNGVADLKGNDALLEYGTPPYTCAGDADFHTQGMTCYMCEQQKRHYLHKFTNYGSLM